MAPLRDENAGTPSETRAARLETHGREGAERQLGACGTQVYSFRSSDGRQARSRAEAWAPHHPAEGREAAGRADGSAPTTGGRRGRGRENTERKRTRPRANGRMCERMSERWGAGGGVGPTRRGAPRVLSAWPARPHATLPRPRSRGLSPHSPHGEAAGHQPPRRSRGPAQAEGPSAPQGPVLQRGGPRGYWAVTSLAGSI